VEAVQGMDLKIAVEDLGELYNYIDTACENKIQIKNFCDSLSFITSKVGNSQIESQMNRGVIQAKRNVTNTQLIFSIMK
jgi:hypothetical protein